MVTKQQVRNLMEYLNKGYNLEAAAAKSGMDPKTARKYLRLGLFPREAATPHDWETRENAYKDVWDDLQEMLELNPRLEAKTLFEHLQREYPGRFADGGLRTFQRRVKDWRATEGPSKEVFFAQRHRPGELSESDFTDMSGLDVTIQGRPFRHMIYHFVLTYSNWEDATICLSESFEALSTGFQNACFRLGGVTKTHQMDSLSAAVRNMDKPKTFTDRFQGLMRHYGVEPRKTNPESPNENGDIEQRHHRFKRAVDQSLMLRGSRDFSDNADYESFLAKLLKQLNAGRRERLAEEMKVLRALPTLRLDAFTRLKVRVGCGSTISVNRNVYSVNSRLIGEEVRVDVHAERIEVWHAQKHMDTFPRLRGRGGHKINYRHIIDWLVRKPGAFENYRYHEDLFPTLRFRIAYDALKSTTARASKEYLAILEMAAKVSESAVDAALGRLIGNCETISAETVKEIVESSQASDCVTDVTIEAPDLSDYDTSLLCGKEAV